VEGSSPPERYSFAFLFPIKRETPVGDSPLETFSYAFFISIKKYLVEG